MTYDPAFIALDARLTAAAERRERDRHAKTITLAEGMARVAEIRAAWRASAIPSHNGPHPQGEGESATAAYQACLTAARALLATANRAHPETW